MHRVCNLRQTKAACLLINDVLTDDGLQVCKFHLQCTRDRSGTLLQSASKDFDFPNCSTTKNEERPSLKHLGRHCVKLRGTNAEGVLRLGPGMSLPQACLWLEALGSAEAAPTSKFIVPTADGEAKPGASRAASTHTTQRAPAHVGTHKYQNISCHNDGRQDGLVLNLNIRSLLDALNHLSLPNGARTKQNRNFKAGELHWLDLHHQVTRLETSCHVRGIGRGCRTRISSRMEESLLGASDFPGCQTFSNTVEY